MGNDWLLIGFAAFVLTGTGLAAALAAGERKSLPIAVQAWAAAVALALLAAGGACAVLHLGRPELIFGALAHPSTGIFREFVTTGLTAVVLAAYLVALLRRAEAGTTHMLARAGALLALCTAAAVGSAFYMPWRAGWNTIAIVLPYAAWCLAGGAFAAEVLSEVSDEAEPSERKRSAFAALLSLAALAAYVAATVVSDGAAPVLSRVAGGDLTGLFAGAVVFGSTGAACPARFLRAADSSPRPAASSRLRRVPCSCSGPCSASAFLPGSSSHADPAHQQHIKAHHHESERKGGPSRNPCPEGKHVQAARAPLQDRGRQGPA